MTASIARPGPRVGHSVTEISFRRARIVCSCGAVVLAAHFNPAKLYGRSVGTFEGRDGELAGAFAQHRAAMGAGEARQAIRDPEGPEFYRRYPGRAG